MSKLIENPYYYVSWDELEKATKKLAEKLKDIQWNGIVAITRGGLVPANILAYELEIKQIETIGVESYEAIGKQKDIRLIKSPSKNIGDGKGWLFIDDLVDNGVTAQFIRNQYSGAKIASVYAKTHGKNYPDYYAVETPKESWIILPWDEDPVSST